MISNNLIPEKINAYHVYFDGVQTVGTMPDFDLPTVKMISGDILGAGVLGKIDSPTIGQFESIEQDLKFNCVYSTAIEMLNVLETVRVTVRAAQQVYNKTGGYVFKGLRVEEQGRIKELNLGKAKPGEPMEVTLKMELTYLMVENDGVTMLEIDKLNEIYKINGTDMLAGIAELL